jgi:hypothetical protein
MSDINNNNNDLNEDNALDSNWVELIQKNWGKYCSSCGAEKDLTKMKVFRKVGPVTQIISECQNCGMKTLITSVPNIGMHINQIRTDMTDPAELERLTSPVTSNDYLNFYNETKNIMSTKELISMLNKSK